MRDSEVRETLQKYDWDGSGDIDFNEFEGLVLPVRPALCCVKQCECNRRLFVLVQFSPS